MAISAVLGELARAPQSRLLPDKIEYERFAVLLDVDGTILDIAPSPHEVDVPITLRQTLARIAERTGGALALVSGRSLADLDLVFSPLRLPAIGGHGAEIRPSADGQSYERRAASLNAELKLQLQAIAALHPGVFLEDKGYAVALHYRADPARGPELLSEATRICLTQPPRTIELLTGKAVIEIKSAGFNKGTAVRELMSQPPFAGRTPIFIGDDRTDEDAFAVMPEFDGIAISVGRKLPGIDSRFQTPAEVRVWLERVANDGIAP